LRCARPSQIGGSAPDAEMKVNAMTELEARLHNTLVRPLIDNGD
jgi:hypothetical protein